MKILTNELSKIGAKRDKMLAKNDEFKINQLETVQAVKNNKYFRTDKWWSVEIRDCMLSAGVEAITIETDNLPIYVILTEDDSCL